MASADGVREWVHPFISDQGTLAEIIKGIQQGLEAVTESIDIVEDGFRIESAFGLSLDALGALFGHERQEGLGDNDYRNQLLTLVEDSTTQTVDIIEQTVEWISGYTPTVEEPDPGTIRVRLPLNKVQYSADVYAQLNRVKAAGIRVIVGHLEEFFESFSETLLVTDHLFNMLRGMFYDSFIEPWPLIGGSGQWDWGNWDVSGAKWDSSAVPSDILFIWWTHRLIEAYSDANWDDVLFFVGVLYLVETFGTYSDALSFEGTFYLSETITSFLDDLGYSGLLALIDVFSPVLSDEDLYLEGIYYFTEALLASAFDELLTIGPWFEEIWRPFGWDKGQWEIDSWDQDVARDALWFGMATPDLTDSYSDTNWDDELYFEGILYEIESYVAGNLADDLDFVGVLYETESLGTPTEDLEFEGILYEIETFSSYSDNLSRIGVALTDNYADTNWEDELYLMGILYEIESLGTPTESLEFEGILYEVEVFSSYSDVLTRIGVALTDSITSFYTESIYFEGIYYPTETLLSSAIDDAFSSNVPFMEFFDSKTNVAYSKIGTAKIGTAKIGPALYYDPSTNTLVIKEVME